MCDLFRKLCQAAGREVQSYDRLLVREQFSVCGLDEQLTWLLLRFYERAEEGTLPDTLKDCMALFRSEALFLLLSNFTGLKLHFLAPEEEEDEIEDTKEEKAASAPDGTEEGTSYSSSEPEQNQAALSNNSPQSNEQTDPEPGKNEAKKGKLRYDSSLFSITHSPFTHLFIQQLFLEPLLYARPRFKSWRTKQTRSLLSSSLHSNRRGQRLNVYTNN